LEGGRVQEQGRRDEWEVEKKKQKLGRVQE